MTGLKTLAAFSAELAFPDSNEYKGKKNNSRTNGGKWEQSWQRRAGSIRR